MASASAGDAPAPAAKSYSTDPALYIYTSLTAGSSHIVTATSRLETILRANRVPFKAIDLATDEKARMLWGRRAGKDESGRVRKLPGLVQEGLVLGDLVEIEEWNEYGELKQHVKIFYDEFTQPSISQAPKLPPAPTKPAAAAVAAAATAAAAHAAAPTPPPLPVAKTPIAEKPKTPAGGATVTLPIRPAAANVAEEAAQKAKQMRLQSLRDKVHGKAGTASDHKGSTTKEPQKEEVESESSEDDDDDDKDEEEDSSSEEETTKKPPASAGLQSPNSTGWKTTTTGAGAGALQSPTSTSWKPTDVNPPITSFMGAAVKPASPEEIAALERAETIKEEEEEEEDESEDESDEDEDKDEMQKQREKDRKPRK